jgi:hypothetical protein
LFFGALDQLVKFVIEFAGGVFRIFRFGHFGDPFAFGRSTPTSRNSSGPLVSRRSRWGAFCRMSGGIGDLVDRVCGQFGARNIRPGLPACLARAFTVSPSSTNRRMASERVAPLALAQFMICVINALVILTPYSGSVPVAGRPAFLRLRILTSPFAAIQFCSKSAR